MPDLIATSEGIALKARPLASGDLEVSGFAAIFGVEDAEGEILEPSDELPSILDEAVKAGVPILYEHRAGQVLGRLIEAKVRPAGIWIKARLTKPAAGTKLAATFEAVKSGALKGLSFRGPILKTMRAGSPTRIRLRRLLEVSIAPRPVQHLAQLEAVAAKAMAEQAATCAEDFGVAPAPERTVGYL